MANGRRRTGGWRAAALLAALLAAAPAPAQEKKPGPPRPEKVLLRLAVHEGDRYRFGIQEVCHRAMEIKDGIVEDLSLGREGEFLVLKAAADGGAEVRVHFNRAHGSSAWGRGHPESFAFDSDDKARDAASADESVRSLMDDAGRGLDLTLSPRGEVTDLRPPADGSPPSVEIPGAGKDPRATASIRSDFQKLFAVLPEKEVGAKASWTVKHDEWMVRRGQGLGPFTEKLTVSAKPEDTVKVQSANGEAKRPMKPDLQKGPASRQGGPETEEPKGFDRGPFDLEIKGTLDVSVATGILDHRKLDLSLGQKQWKPAVPPFPFRVTYSCEVTCTKVPAK